MAVIVVLCWEISVSSMKSGERYIGLRVPRVRINDEERVR